MIPFLANWNFEMFIYFLLKYIIKLSDIIWYVSLANSIFAWQALKTKILKIASHYYYENKKQNKFVSH